MTERKARKVQVGKVVGDKMDKSVVIAIETLVRHPLYGKIVKSTKRFQAHDEENACRVGDKVRVMETRPISKNKRWRVIEILDREQQI